MTSAPFFFDSNNDNILQFIVLNGPNLRHAERRGEEAELAARVGRDLRARWR
jgi:hypothetical protein